MWLASIGIALQHRLAPSVPVPDTASAFDPQNAEAMRALAKFLDAARWPVILVSSFNISLLFWLLSRKIDRRAAFLAAGLIALDPFGIGLGSILHVDSLLATFCLVSIAALIIAIDHPRPVRWLILSGLLAGLAALSKSPAIVLGPTVFISLAIKSWRQRQSLRHFIRSFFIWGLSATLIFFALYPAMWVKPIEALSRMASTAEKFSEFAHAINYFFGSLDRNPGPLFYPVVLAFRSTPILWLGLIAFVILMLRARSNAEQRLRANALIFALFAVLFMALITIGAKKLDRYVFPALLALDSVGALGLAYTIGLITDRWPNRSRMTASIAIGVCLAVVSIQFISVWPLSLRSYNPLLGGYTGAARALPVGGGESAQVARDLAASPFASKAIAVSDIIGTAPFFQGRLVPNDESGFAQADYFLFNASDFQVTPDLPKTWIGAATPVLTFSVQNQSFAWLYPNQWLMSDQQRLIDQRQAGDAVVTDYPAALPARADDPTIVLPKDISEAAAIDQLSHIAQSHSRIFFSHYTASRESTSIVIRRLLDTFAIKVNDWSSPLSTGALYVLPKNGSFTAVPTPLNVDAFFAGRAQLTQADLVLSHVQPGQSIGLDTRWIASLPESQLSLTLNDAQGHTWSQIEDRIPANDNGATERAKRLTLPVEPTTPPGLYQLKLSAFDLDSGTLLNIHTGDNPFAGQEWTLGSVTIDPAQVQIDPATRKPPLEINADLNGLRAIGSDAPPDPINSGDPWTLSMEWASISDHLPNLDVAWLFVANHQVAYSITLPLNSYPTDQWHTGDVLKSKYDFRLPIAIAAGKYDLKFMLFDHTTGQALDAQTIPLTTVEVAARQRSFTPPAVQQPSGTQFGSLATLLGANELQSDQLLTVTLIWQASQITATNYTAFVQIMNGDQVVKQIDNWQLGGDAPTSTWAAGQVILDQYVFDVPAGHYQVAVGLYDAATGQRLAAIDATGQRLPQD
ncbi:MAG TPA: glycosyltransferase family 39 protein, partial [Anaerolineae bacterium]|nr:glycosyltransferase family 39 protein [Anaerolineae bacterium]